MANTLLVAGDTEDYGATHDEDNRVLPVAMLDWNPHPTSSKNQPSRRPSSWKIKRVVLGIIIGVMAAVIVMSSATGFLSLRKDTSPGPESVLLQHYPFVTITNKTPYKVRPPKVGQQSVLYFSDPMHWLCPSEYMYDGLPAGQTWTATSRGLCLVWNVRVTLAYPSKYPRSHPKYHPSQDYLLCALYSSSGTSHSIYSILMKGDDACCVKSSHELQECD